MILVNVRPTSDVLRQTAHLLFRPNVTVWSDSTKYRMVLTSPITF